MRSLAVVSFVIPTRRILFSQRFFNKHVEGEEAEECKV